MKLKAFLEDERGATANEYALIVAIVCTSIIVALMSYANMMNTTYGELSDTIEGVD